jgi:hypothetical protein
LKITAPPVSVTSFIIEDRDAVEDGFPDVPVTPEGWRILVDGLQRELQDMALAGGLMTKAEEGSRSFLAGMFTAAGYDYVEFTDL